MLNYNVNYIEPSKQDKKGVATKPLMVWNFDERSAVLLSPNLPPLANASMSILASASNCIGVDTSSGNFFVSDAQAVVSSSLVGAGVWPTTGSVTMSLIAVGVSPINSTLNYTASFSASAKAGNLNLSGSILRVNFTSPLNYDWYFSGSIIHRYGNEYNSNINCIESGSTKCGTNATFNIVQNANLVRVPSMYMTSSVSGTFKNNYAFNTTASISGSTNWANSSSFQALTMSISIPEIGYYVTSSHTASIVTGSFVPEPTTGSYNITASVELEPYPPYPLAEFVFIGNGGNGADTGVESAGSGGGAGALVSGSDMIILADSVYNVYVGDYDNGSYLSTAFITGSSIYVKAPNGGNGSYTDVVNNGGSGAGASGGAPSYANFVSGGLSIPATGSGTWFTNITGSRGGKGYQYISPTPIPPYGFRIAGGGGGAAGPGGDAEINFNTHASGGLGVTNNMITYITGVTGSFANGGIGGWAPSGTGNTGTDTLGYQTNRNGINYGDGGGGGTAAANTGRGVAILGGTGKKGIVVFKYLGTQKGRGGSVTYDGTYTYHTFTSSGLFYSTANMLPKMH